jgi:hypothetical protein
MAQSKWVFAQLYDVVSGISKVKFDFSDMEESDLDFVESMCTDGLNKLMAMKAEILNKKEELKKQSV